jgi:hypothetical protein
MGAILATAGFAEAVVLLAGILFCGLGVGALLGGAGTLIALLGSGSGGGPSIALGILGLCAEVLGLLPLCYAYGSGDLTPPVWSLAELLVIAAFLGVPGALCVVSIVLGCRRRRAERRGEDADGHRAAEA